MLHLIALWFALSGATALHQRGVELYKQKKYADAIAALEEAVKTENGATPEYRESVLMIGQSYYMLSQAPKAIPWLEKLPAINEANYMLGYAYLQAGQADRSEAAFARLFGLAPSTASAHLLAGQMMLKQEYEAQALAEINKALSLNSKLPEACYLLGVVAIYRGRFDEAEADLKQELAVNPSFAMAWYRLGDAYARREQLDEAIPDLQRAVWSTPSTVDPIYCWASAISSSGTSRTPKAFCDADSPSTRTIPRANICWARRSSPKERPTKEKRF